MPARWVPQGSCSQVTSILGPEAPGSSLTHLLPGSPAPSGPFSGCLCRPACLFLRWPEVTTLFASALQPLRLPLFRGRRCDPIFSLPSLPGQARGGGAEKQGAEGRGLEVKPRGKEVSRTARQLQQLRSSGGSLAHAGCSPSTGVWGEGGWPGASALLLVFVHVKN